MDRQHPVSVWSVVKLNAKKKSRLAKVATHIAVAVVGSGVTLEQAKTFSVLSLHSELTGLHLEPVSCKPCQRQLGRPKLAMLVRCDDELVTTEVIVDMSACEQ